MIPSIQCPYCHASAPAIYEDGAFFSAHCCEIMEIESEAHEDLVPFEWIAITPTRLLAQANWQNVCQVLGGAV